MNPSKAWALMTARGASIGGIGGTPELRASDVARMLRGLERGPFLAGMVRESGDISCVGDLERWLWIETIKLADPLDDAGRLIVERQWPRSHGQAYCRRLAGLAVFEFVAPRPSVCDRCKGRGWVRNQGQGVACPECGSDKDEDGSTGGKKLTPEERSDLAGIPLRSWQDGGWAGRYEIVHATLGSWHSIAMSHLRRELESRFAIA